MVPENEYRASSQAHAPLRTRVACMVLGRLRPAPPQADDIFGNRYSLDAYLRLLDYACEACLPGQPNPMIERRNDRVGRTVIINAVEWCTPTVARTRGGLQMLHRRVTLSKGMRQERGVAWMSSVFVTG